MIKAIIFDLDNTLINFWEFKQKAILSAAKQIQIHLSSSKNLEEIFDGIFQIYYVKGIDYQYAISDYLLSLSLSKEEHNRILNLAIKAYKSTKQSFLQPYPAVVEMLNELKKMNFKLGVLTDASYVQALDRLEKCNLKNYFDAITTFDHSKSFKPSKAPFLHIIAQLDVRPEQAAMVGDNPHRDIKGAKELGLTTFLAKWGFYYGDDGTKPDFALDHPAELPKILKKLNSFSQSFY
ncbi:MAG: HAD-IA family hydrolase [Candidatus Micrarchaeota archaeon]|nr:HAD-IA family hydrolase [Candidatus Micrarchaeota archaeon]